MIRISKFGYEWLHKPTNRRKGTQINVKTMEEYGEYKQVKRKAKEENKLADKGEKK